MLSVLNGHTDCVYSLLNKGANVDAKDKWGRTALHRGVREYSFSVLSSFIHINLKYRLYVVFMSFSLFSSCHS